jgi:hypothetical protein
VPDTVNSKYLDAALALARRGFHVFQLQANTKDPILKGYPTKATRDETQIREWWGKKPYCNVGISTSSFNGGDSALLVVDIDVKEGKKGDESVIQLELEGKEFPPTFTQRTPSGGKHFVYRVKESVGQTAGKIARGIDTRSRGGFIVGAGSELDGRVYDIEPGFESDPEWAPDWLVQYNSDAQTRTEEAPPPPASLDAKRARTRAAEWLTTAAVAVQGAGGDQTTFRVAAKLKDFGLSQKEAADLLTYPGGWNDRCSPPWALAELNLKIRNAYEYGGNPVGTLAPELYFDPVPPASVPAVFSDTEGPAATGGGGFYLDRMNEEYALVYADGSHFILHETVDQKGRPARRLLSELTFKRRFSTQMVQGEGRRKPISWAEMWLDWSGRREYAGLCFSPGRETQHGYYNTWKGFAAEPLEYALAPELARKGFDRFMEHALQNVCQGDERLCDWLMGYFAHLIQKPYERPLTTLVFKGEKGTGKNALIDRVGRLLGREHYLVAHNKRYLTSNFNGHMESCLCLVLDEAFWSGEKDAEGVLKGLTTASEIMIERKGREPYMADNLARLVVIGNENWLVPASADERRYAVFSMGTGRMQQNEYFEEMRIWLDEEGGNAILLDYLQHRECCDTSRAPATQGLYDQKVASQEPFADWWLDCLQEGRIIGSDFGDTWLRDVPKESVREAYTRHVRERNLRVRLPSRNTFSQMLKKISPETELNQKKREGELTFYIFRLPELKEARDEWDKRMGHKTAWNA